MSTETETANTEPGATLETDATFYMSFGSGYRRTEFFYDDMGNRHRATRHPVFPENVDGRGFVRVLASSRGRARYLASFYFKNEYSGLYDNTEMRDSWNSGYVNSASSFARNNGTLELGVLDNDGLHWAPHQAHTE